MQPRASGGRAVACRAVAEGPPAAAAAMAASSSPPSRESCYLHLLGPAEVRLLAALRAEVPAVVDAAGLSSIWGVALLPETEASDVVLLKFLRAAGLDAGAAAKRLESTLRYRREHDVDGLQAVDLGKHFHGHDDVGGRDSEGRPVMVSRYGQMDNDKVFGNREAFVRYRCKIMEQALVQLSFEKGAPEDLCQVHDYTGIPLLFKTAEVKGAIEAMSSVFSEHYPETKGKTIFVNFPVAFSRIFQAFSMFLPERTRKKFLIFGESDQGLLFQHLSPEVVPEALGGLLRPGGGGDLDVHGDGKVAPCSVVEVSAGAVEEATLQHLTFPATVAWEIRVCTLDIDYEVVFQPSDGSPAEVVQASATRGPLQAAHGVVSGRYSATRAGVLKCRFRNDRAWFQSKLCLCRAGVVDVTV